MVCDDCYRSTVNIYTKMELLFGDCLFRSKGSLSQIDHDLDGTKEAETNFDILPENITLDTAARSFVYDFKRDVSVNRIELFPDTYTYFNLKLRRR